MKKLLKYVFIIVLCLAFALSLAACIDGGEGDCDCDDCLYANSTRLTMTTPRYDNATKKVTWSAVPNAIGYCLTFMGQNISKTETLFATEYTVAEQTDGQFLVSIIALGDGTNYSDSTEKRILCGYTVAPARLDAPQILRSKYSIRWVPVANAQSYEFTAKLDGTVIYSKANAVLNDLYNAELGVFEYFLDETHNGTVNFKITALGNGTTTFHSAAAELEFDYVYVAASYQNIIDMLLPKAEIAIKAMTEHRLAHDFRIIQVMDIRGDAVVRYNYANTEYIRTISLGSASNFANLDKAFVYVERLEITYNMISESIYASIRVLTDCLLDFVVANMTWNPVWTVDDVEFAYCNGMAYYDFGSTYATIKIYLNDGREIEVPLKWESSVIDANDIYGQLAELEKNGAYDSTALVLHGLR